MQDHRNQHAFFFIIYAKQRFSGDDILSLYILSGSTYDLKIPHLFYGDFCRYGHTGGKRGHLSVIRFFTRGLMVQDSRFGRNFLSWYIPLLGGSVYQHLPGSCSSCSQWLPALPDPLAATCELPVK